MKFTAITLIVPTKNEAANIERFIKSIPEEINIIVVDASTDDTCEIIKAHRNTGSLQIIKDSGNIAAARQLAAKHAETEWLLYTDADVVFDENYFSTLGRIRLSPRHGGLVGGKLSRDRYRCYYFIFSQWLRFCCAIGLPGASGSNMLINRRALLEIGGFDLALSCNEDTELIWRLQRNGYCIGYDRRLKVYEIDHRRLDRGVLPKIIHSLSRCVLLLCGLKPLLRNNDWGYWNSKPTEKHLVIHSNQG
jgi:glycosyltransferase involved in cell wall biosynthesis